MINAWIQLFNPDEFLNMVLPEEIDAYLKEMTKLGSIQCNTRSKASMKSNINVKIPKVRILILGIESFDMNFIINNFKQIKQF